MGSPTGDAGEPPPRTGGRPRGNGEKAARRGTTAQIRGPSRRTLLFGGLAGAAGGAAIPLALDRAARGAPGDLATAASGGTSRPGAPGHGAQYSFNTGWVFGEYAPRVRAAPL